MNTVALIGWLWIGGNAGLLTALTARAALDNRRRRITAELAALQRRADYLTCEACWALPVRERAT